MGRWGIFWKIFFSRSLNRFWRFALFCIFSGLGFRFSRLYGLCEFSGLFSTFRKYSPTHSRKGGEGLNAPTWQGACLLRLPWTFFYLLSVAFFLGFLLETAAVAQEINPSDTKVQENFSNTLSEPEAKFEGSLSFSSEPFEGGFSDEFNLKQAETLPNQQEDRSLISPFLEQGTEKGTETSIENFNTPENFNAPSPEWHEKPIEDINAQSTKTLLTPVLESEFSPKNIESADPPRAAPRPKKMKKITEKSKIPTIEKLLQAGHLDDVIVEQGIERSDRIASYLLLEAKAALNKGKEEEAIKLGQMASEVSPLSPIPSFFMAKAIWQIQPLNVIDILAHYMTGLRLVFGDFLFMLPILSPILLFLLLAVFFSMLTFILYSLFSYTPIWVHQISEASKGYLHFIPATLLFALLFFMPLLMGLPMIWFLLFSFVLFWGFYKRLEKGLVLTFIVTLGASTWLLPFLLTLFTANGSLLLNEMSRNHHSDFLWTPPPLELKNSGWEGFFIRASYESQRGNYKRAAQYYKKALKIHPNSPKIFNNLGNLSYYSKDYDQAILHYQNAIEAAPSLVSAHYNLSQTYREMLQFEKGDAVFEKARKISTQTTENYAMKSERYPEYPVIEERFTKGDLWTRLLNKTGEEAGFSERIWQGMLGEISLSKAPLLGVFWIILLNVSGFLYGKFFSGKQCAFCKKAICKHCARRLFSYQVCRPCEMRFMTVRRKSDFAIVENAVKKIPARLYPIFLIPGGGHLAIRKTKTGFFLLVLFFLSLCTIFLGEYLVPPTEWYLHRTGSFLPKISLFLLYLVAFLDLSFKRSAHKWL